MSNISKLIQELCPDGVEFVEISSIAVRNKGISITAAKMKKMIVTNGPIRLFAAGQNFIDTSDQYVDTSKIIDTPSIIVKSRGHIGFEYYDKPFQHKSEMWSYEVISDAVNIKFLYYYLLSKSRYFQDLARATSVKLPQLSVKDTDNFRIPVPPLVVQEEIVRILDRFTLLEAELEAELEARTKQYAFYRKILLNTANEYVSIDSVSKNLDNLRKPIAKGKRIGGCYPYYGASGVVDYVDGYIFEGDYLLISEDGANLLARSTPIAFSIKGQNWVNNHAHILKFEDLEEQRIVEYYLNSIDISQFVSSGAQPKLTKNNLNKFMVPKFSPEARKNICQALDRFESLVNDISSGLPAEIAARRKQYEHYRDQLLTFKELEPAGS